MLDKGKLRRVDVDGMPEAAMTNAGNIIWRHYLISAHAIDRFVERCERPAEEFIPMLSSAFLACPSRARSARIRKRIVAAEARKGYVLLNGQCYFIVVPNEKGDQHIVKTVLSPKYIY